MSMIYELQNLSTVSQLTLANSSYTQFNHLRTDPVLYHVVIICIHRLFSPLNKAIGTDLIVLGRIGADEAMTLIPIEGGKYCPLSLFNVRDQLKHRSMMSTVRSSIVRAGGCERPLSVVGRHVGQLFPPMLLHFPFATTSFASALAQQPIDPIDEVQVNISEVHEYILQLIHILSTCC